jgi:hypothetical protein
MKRLLAALVLAMGLSLAQGVVLRALMEDVPETRIIEELLPRFERETGIRVEFEKVQYAAMHDKLVAQLLAPQSAYDFLQWTSSGRGSSRRRGGWSPWSPT